ncbi:MULTISPECIES: zf-HC2 domain-containing protein [unclassified Streptomyces]|uniref:zf-HC2 domain-containing protein n=1 Tax=Streptomyces sp. NPDC127129 TaxID=3345373 RepID=UPI0036417AAC
MTELSPPATPTSAPASASAPARHRHLPADWVGAYARGELSPEVLGHAEAHLERCGACADAVDRAVRSGPHGPRLDAALATLVNRVG